MNQQAVLRHREDNQRTNILYITAMLISLLISAYIDFKETLINPDAICYLSSAEAIGRLGIKGAAQLCGQAKWPFYSILIYAIVQITHLSYATAAYTFNSIFSVISVVMFILIVKELGGSRRTLWLAAAVILFAHQFNSVREYIIRDHGFWAFYLTSIFLLLHFYRQPRWLTAIAWSMSLLLATLFRIEGAVFLLILPFVSWFFIGTSMKSRLRCFMQLNTLLIIIGLTSCTFLLLHPTEKLAFSRVFELIDQLQHGVSLISASYLKTKAALAQYVLNTDSFKDAGTVLPCMIISWYLISVLQNLSLIYALLVVYAWRRSSQFFSTPAKLILVAYIFVNLIVTIVFLLEHFFLSNRYLLALSLVLMLWVPFALNELLEQKRRLLLVIAALFIAISAAGGIFDFGYSKTYIADAGDWLAKNVPKEATLYANDYQLMYYSHHYGDALFTKMVNYIDLNTIADGKWKQYDYVALRNGRKDEAAVNAVIAQIAAAPVKVYSNKRGDKVVIYKLKP